MLYVEPNCAGSGGDTIPATSLRNAQQVPTAEVHWRLIFFSCPWAIHNRPRHTEALPARFTKTRPIGDLGNVVKLCTWRVPPPRHQFHGFGMARYQNTVARLSQISIIWSSVTRRNLMRSRRAALPTAKFGASSKRQS